VCDWARAWGGQGKGPEQQLSPCKAIHSPCLHPTHAHHSYVAHFHRTASQLSGCGAAVPALRPTPITKASPPKTPVDTDTDDDDDNPLSRAGAKPKEQPDVKEQPKAEAKPKAEEEPDVKEQPKAEAKPKAEEQPDVKEQPKAEAKPKAEEEQPATEPDGGEPSRDPADNFPQLLPPWLSERDNEVEPDKLPVDPEDPNGDGVLDTLLYSPNGTAYTGEPGPFKADGTRWLGPPKGQRGGRPGSIISELDSEGVLPVEEDRLVGDGTLVAEEGQLPFEALSELMYSRPHAARVNGTNSTAVNGTAPAPAVALNGSGLPGSPVLLASKVAGLASKREQFEKRRAASLATHHRHRAHDDNRGKEEHRLQHQMLDQLRKARHANATKNASAIAAAAPVATTVVGSNATVVEAPAAAVNSGNAAAMGIASGNATQPVPPAPVKNSTSSIATPPATPTAVLRRSNATTVSSEPAAAPSSSNATMPAAGARMAVQDAAATPARAASVKPGNTTTAVRAPFLKRSNAIAAVAPRASPSPSPSVKSAAQVPLVAQQQLPPADSDAEDEQADAEEEAADADYAEEEAADDAEEEAADEELADAEEEGDEVAVPPAAPAKPAAAPAKVVVPTKPDAKGELVDAGSCLFGWLVEWVTEACSRWWLREPSLTNPPNASLHNNKLAGGISRRMLGFRSALADKGTAVQAAAAHAASPKAIFMGPAWHDLGIAPLSLKTLGQTGRCYMKEVRFALAGDAPRVSPCCVLWGFELERPVEPGA